MRTSRPTASAAVKITDACRLPARLTDNGVAVVAGNIASAWPTSPAGLLKFTPAANANGAGYASFTFQVQDDGGTANGGQDTDPTARTMTVNVTPVKDVFVTAQADVMTREETPYVFTWADFQVSDWDSTDTTITIDSLPASGQLEYLGAQGWTTVAARQTFSRDQIAAGTLRFVPAANQSGCPGYNSPGFGDMKNHYAAFDYQANDDIFSTDVASMILDVNPVADPPSLSLYNAPGACGAQSTLFDTSWEGAPNWSHTSTILPQSSLEGWNVVRQSTDASTQDGRDGGQSAFIIWSSGDRMKDASNKDQTVYAAPGDGNNWLELGNAMGEGHQTYGIERTVNTRAGMTYNLSLDYAGALGYGADFTAIGIYVDGVKIATHAGTSSNTALNWQKLNFSFIGTGAAQNIRIVTEATSSQSNGRGAMLDNIALTEVLPVNTGYQDQAFHLSNIVAIPEETNGSDLLSVRVSTIPAGALLTDGVNSFTASATSGSVDVTGWNLANLMLTAPLAYTGSFALTVTARCTELANGDTADSTVALGVTVVPATVTTLSVIDLLEAGAAGASSGMFGPHTDDALRGGFLAVDANGNGVIDNASELFTGSAADAYARLMAFDSNHDGVIDASDARFNDLRIWYDANGNRQTDGGELRTLAELGVTRINLGETTVPEDHDRHQEQEGVRVSFSDGHTGGIAEAYFALGPNAAATSQPDDRLSGRDAGKPDADQPKILGIPLGLVPGSLPWEPEGVPFFAPGIANTAPPAEWNTDAATAGSASSDASAQGKKQAKSRPESDDQGWLTDFLGVKEQEINVADATGLNVSTPVVEEPKQPFVERRQRVSIAPDGTKLTNDR